MVFSQIYLINPNISDIAASALFTAFKEFQKSQQIRAFFSHQRHKRALDETYPQPGFYPSNRIELLYCRQGEELADSLIDNVVGLWYETRKGNQVDFNTQAKYQSSINRILGVFEQKLTNSAYLFNETVSAVDVAAISGVGYYSLRFGHNWQQEYPKLSQWFELLHQRKSIDSTMPKA